MDLSIKALGNWALYADALMHPIMVYLLGAPGESPQRTHKWNYRSFSEDELEYLPDALKRSLVVKLPGNKNAGPAHWCGIPILHLTRFGGWKEYVVLEAYTEHEWYAGWWTDGHVGISRVPVYGKVRLLIPPDPVIYFGVLRDGTQVPLRAVSQGRIGDGGPYRLVPLL